MTVKKRDVHTTNLDFIKHWFKTQSASGELCPNCEHPFSAHTLILAGEQKVSRVACGRSDCDCAGDVAVGVHFEDEEEYETPNRYSKESEDERDSTAYFNQLLGELRQKFGMVGVELPSKSTMVLIFGLFSKVKTLEDKVVLLEKDVQELRARK